jgi:hypothetical protein
LKSTQGPCDDNVPERRGRGRPGGLLVGPAGAQEPVVRGAEAHLPGCRATIPKEIFILEDASSDPKRIYARMPRYNPKRDFYFRRRQF